MLAIISKLYFKIIRKINKQNFLSHKNISVGKNFELGNYTTSIIHPTSEMTIGNNVSIRNFLNIVIGNKANMIIENNVFFNNHCSINCLESITIGENTLLGEGVKIYDHNHNFNSKFVDHKNFKTSAIKIGKNCWLGSNVIILKGVTIGNNVIIGAGCVVHKDIASNQIVLNNQELIYKDNL